MSHKTGADPFTVLVEGNIGSGKTTFLNYFDKFNDVCPIAESIDMWRNCGGVNLLDLLYKEPYRWAMPFQTYVTLTQLSHHMNKTEKCVKLIERSLFSARYCFVEHMLATGALHQGMYNILQEWYDYFQANIHIQVDLIVYLRTTPEVAYERVRKRSRAGESPVTFDFFQQLHALHENWLIHGQCYQPAPVLILNADLDLESIVAEYKQAELNIFNQTNKKTDIHYGKNWSGKL